MKFRRISLVFLLLFSAEVFAQQLVLPEQSNIFSKQSALSLLDLCTGHTGSLTARRFEDYGFSIVKQVNYDRPADAVNHTSAYTIGKGSVEISGKKKPCYLVIIRGSDGTEWFANFNFVPSQSDEAEFAMNFLLTAEDVLLDLTSIIREENPLIVVSGHSRGGAASNLLTLLLNELYDSRNIYAYTFATPATVKNSGKINWKTDENIFNILNPCDVVPRLPLAVWGFKRAGTDIFLDADSEKISKDKLDNAMEKLSLICPSINSYYSCRHSLTQSGESENGTTAYEIMLSFGSILSKLSAGNMTDAEIENSEDFFKQGLSFGASADFSFSAVESSSDLLPLLEYVGKLMRNNAEGFINLLSEHMPDTYKAKILRY